MKHLAATASLLALSAGAVSAGGIDRSRLNYGILFEKGTYAELGFSHVSPDVSGTYGPLTGPFNGSSTGGAADNYTTFSLSYKQDINERLSFGLFVNTPYGADVAYGAGPYTGLQAEWKSTQIAALLRYDATDAISVYGGLRYLRSEASIEIPASLLTFNYTAEGSTEDLGYVVGVAYEKPEIALRVGLTYESAIKHAFPTTETGAPFGPDGVNTTTDIEMPQTLTLDFQSGIAEDTLLFGSIRWSEWSVWKVRPPGYGGVIGQDITGFDNDVITYQLGIGRRINENWSVFARASFEDSKGGIASRLSPTDGQKTFGIGGTYTKDAMKITAGIEYVDLGDAIDGSGTVFEGNKAVGFGISVGYRF
jgi:long-chain fatty acid transport protein